MDTLITQLESTNESKYRTLIEALKDLQQTTGLDNVKERVCRQVKYALYNRKHNIAIDGMHHILITGEPGLGKSMLATKLGNIWMSMGILQQPAPENDTTKVELEMKEFSNFLAWIHRLGCVPPKKIKTKRGTRYVPKEKMDGMLKHRRRQLRSTVAAYLDSVRENGVTEEKRSEAQTVVKSIVRGDLHPDNDIIVYEDITKPGDLLKTEKVYRPPVCKIFNRADLIGKYVGHTAPKTLKCLRSCLGGVFILDEAYALMNYESCKFGIEALNTINQFMSEHANEIIIIFCGYRDMIQNLYDAQRGLSRRFNWVYNLEKYSTSELIQIFKEKLKEYEFECSDQQLVELFNQKEKRHPEIFKFQAGDMENLAMMTRIEIGTSNWNNDQKVTKIKLEIVNAALRRFWKGRSNKSSKLLPNMYL